MVAPGKRKQNPVTLERKLEVIKELESGRSQRVVADLLFEIPKSTIGGIWNNREKIQNHVTSAEDSSLAKKRCIVRNSQYPLLDDAMNIWFVQMRSKGAAVPSCLIQEKALELFNLYPDAEEGEFKATLLQIYRSTYLLFVMTSTGIP